MGSHPLAPKPDDPLALGERRDEPGEPVTLPAEALLRHVMALGSSGSGKTVFCKVLAEEVALRGVPVIAIDPQGDLASLALAGAEPEPGADESDAEPEAEAHDDTLVDEWAGVESLSGIGAAGPGAGRRVARRAPRLHDRLDVVVFTPASRRGVPLCADPVEAGAARLGHAARVRAFTRTAGRIVSLLGYDLDGDEGAGLLAVFDRCLNEMADEGRPASSLRSVTERLEEMGPKIERYGRYLNERKIRAACQRAARLDVGARRLLFHDGVPIDMDVLLGRDRHAAPPPGKTRVSIIYLNTLEAQEDKDFVVATVADRLVSWMLQNPSPHLQAMFYIDEVAPFMPPVRKPACKEDLQVLFKQARKYGVGCVVASQNPGDVDYKALGQFGTWALGRLATRQDLKKVEPAVRSLMPQATPLLEEVPSLRPGELVLLSPDNFDAPCQLATRWLHSEHRTLEEEKIEELSGPWRERFAALERGGPEWDEGDRDDPEPDDPEPEDPKRNDHAESTIDLDDDDAVSVEEAEEPPVEEARPEPRERGRDDVDRTRLWIRRDADTEPVPESEEAPPQPTDRKRERAAERGRGRAAAARDADRRRGRARGAERAAADRAERAAANRAERAAADRAARRAPARSHAPRSHPPRTHAPGREVPRAQRAGDPDREPEREAPEKRRPEPRGGDPDPSWAWPRDPDLAWIRARSSEPAWAPSGRPPSAATEPEPAPEPAREPRRRRERAGARRRERERPRAPSPDVEASAALDDSEAGPAPAARPGNDTDPKLRRMLMILGGKLSMTGPEFAERAGVSERTARAKLKAMVAAGHAGEFREERTVRYWARHTGARPDLGMRGRVLSVQPNVDHGTAENIGRGLVKPKMLGIIGAGETFAQARLFYRLVYRVAFQEKVKRPLLGRLIGPSHEERLGSLYLHPCTLDVLLFSADVGIRFATRLPDYASEVDDLDGFVTFLEVRPGDISFDEDEWQARVPTALARKRLRETFQARPGAVTPVFVPLWKLLLRRGGGSSYRVETVDALAGRPVDWPDAT